MAVWILFCGLHIFRPVFRSIRTYLVQIVRVGCSTCCCSLTRRPGCFFLSLTAGETGISVRVCWSWLVYRKGLLGRIRMGVVFLFVLGHITTGILFDPATLLGLETMLRSSFCFSFSPSSFLFTCARQLGVYHGSCEYCTYLLELCSSAHVCAILPS